MTIGELKQYLSSCNDNDEIRIVALGTENVLLVNEVEVDDGCLRLYVLTEEDED